MSPGRTARGLSPPRELGVTPWERPPGSRAQGYRCASGVPRVAEGVAVKGDAEPLPRGPPRSASGLRRAAVGTDALPLTPLCHCWERGAQAGTLHASAGPDSSWAGPGHTEVSGGRPDRERFPERPEGVDRGRGSLASPPLRVSVWVAPVLEGA